ncbi:MAG: radical SAM protein [Chloroflexi bacterium]|nr:radical SAM protein [Chloroflexota bacterium]
MRVTLIYPDIEGVAHYGARKYYHGLGYISGVLKAAGHQTSLIYLQQEPTREAFLAQLQAQQPDLVGFSSTTHQHPYVERCAAWIKEALPQVRTVAGGTHPTLVAEEVVKHPALDFVCVGEGEYSLRELAERLETGQSADGVAGIWFRREGEVVRNALRPLIQDLGELPFPDREIFDFDQILQRNNGWVDMMAGRGCPYGCSYCCNPGLQARYKGLGRYVRYRPVANLLGEIRALQARYPLRVINFQDDVFTLNRDWLLEFCSGYAAEFRLPFWINTRVETINRDDVVEALARAGCAGVRIGLESGNEELRRDILKRRMTNDEIRQAFALVRRHGLQAYTCNMLGIPGETPDMIQETIDLNRELAPEQFQFSVFHPYPMTELYETSVRQGYYNAHQVLPTYYSRESVLHLPGMSADEVGEGYDRFVELRRELELKRRSPWKWRVYDALRRLHRGDALRLRRRLNTLATWRRRLRGR